MIHHHHPNLATHKTKIPLFSLLPAITWKLQNIGETSFAALFLIGLLQGAVTLHQYRTNPSGELVVPPGRTVGVEDATDRRMASTQNSSSSSSSLRSGGGSASSMRALLLQELERHNNIEQLQQVEGSFMKRGWYHVSKYLVVLVPFLARQWSFVLARYGHLLHLGVIMSLASTFDFFRKMPELTDPPNDNNKNDSLLLGKRPKVAVIGDSMAIGIGCVNTFDVAKNRSLAMERIERLELPRDHHAAAMNSPMGPVFPRMFARALSKRLERPVVWRSAGVDGGDVKNIQTHCLGVIQEEADKGHPPDVVVVLCGMNDLKKLFAFPTTKASSVRGFRASLAELINEIRKIAPAARVVFPALPTYRLDRNSILNVFPLSIFLDAVMGFWDSQKKHVADLAPSNVLYYGLSVKDVDNWYKENRKDGIETLLAADGLHPNAQCYAQWGALMGHKLADTLLMEKGCSFQQNIGYTS